MTDEFDAATERFRGRSESERRTRLTWETAAPPDEEITTIARRFVDVAPIDAQRPFVDEGGEVRPCWPIKTLNHGTVHETTEPTKELLVHHAYPILLVVFPDASLAWGLCRDSQVQSQGPILGPSARDGLIRALEWSDVGLGGSVDGEWLTPGMHLRKLVARKFADALIAALAEYSGDTGPSVVFLDAAGRPRSPGR